MGRFVSVVMGTDAHGNSQMNAVTALCMAVCAGFVVSFGVEYLQAFLPSRDSSLRDLITNSAGTLIGSMGY